MSDVTVFISLGDIKKAEGWTVYRVRTSSSTYHVAVGPVEKGKRFAILRGYSAGAGRLIDVRDSAPQVGDESLFDVPPSKWVGKKLSFGTATTSAVVEAVRETGEQIITSVIQTLAPQAAEIEPERRRAPPPEPERSAYPEDWVENAETAAEILRRIYQRRTLLDDIRKRPPLWDRLNVAMGECALMLRAIGGKIGSGG